MVSTYVLMRILESTPTRYELGIRLLTLGRVEKAYDRLAAHLESGQRVLDIGCGTGVLTRRAARRGARVVGIDVSAGMLEVAERRARAAGLAERIEFREMGVAELGREPDASYDAVLSGLCLSELSEDELTWALEQARRLLAPGGLLLVADEVRPRGRMKRALFGALRAPLALLTFLIAQQISHPLVGLEARIERAGLAVGSVRTTALGGLVEIVARKPARVAS